MKTFDPVTLCELESESKREQYFYSLYAMLTKNRPDTDIEQYKQLSQMAQQVWTLYLNSQEEKSKIHKRILEAHK